MKTLKLTIIGVVALASLTACKKGGLFCYKADGNIIEETRTVDSFSKIKLNSSFDVIYEQGDVFEVTVKTSKNLMEIVETKVSGETLNIQLKDKKCIKNNFNVTLYVKSPSINSVIINGSADFETLNNPSFNKLDVSIDGSGEVNLDNVSINELDVKINGSGDFDISSADTLVFETISIKGSGGLNTLNVPSKNVLINVDGSGNTKVWAIDNINININGSGDVIYQGSPTTTTNISGSGSVTHL